MNYAEKETDRRLSLMERRLHRDYSEAYIELDEKLRKYLEKFTAKEKQMREQLENGTLKAPNGMDAEEYFNQWRFRRITEGERWKALRDEMARRMTQTNEAAAVYINGKTPDIYALNANYQSFTFESYHDDISFTLIDEGTAEELAKAWKNHTEFTVSNGEGGYTYRKLQIDKKVDYQWNTRRIKAALSMGIYQGESIPQIANRFYDVQQNNMNTAIQNARTAVTSAQNAGRMNTALKAEDMGIKGLKKKWISTSDGRTRDSHIQAGAAYHNYATGVPINEPFKVGSSLLMFPADASGRPEEIYKCRCSFAIIDPVMEYFESIGDPEGRGELDEERFKEWLREKRK